MHGLHAPSPVCDLQAERRRSWRQRRPLRCAGWLQLQAPEGQLLQISFRRGAPEHVSTDDPELGVFRFLVDRKVITPDQAAELIETHIRTTADNVARYAGHLLETE